jgi:hypothetical protein
VLISAGAVVAAMAGCAAESPPPGTADSVAATTSTGGEPASTPISGSAQQVPSSIEIAAIVTASGGGGLIDSVEIAGLSAVSEPAAGQPWLTFDLVLNYCCGDPNDVVFEAGGDGFDIPIGDPPVFRLTGPACDPALLCTPQTRTLGLSAPGPVSLAFQLTPLVSAAELLEAGTLSTRLTPTFNFEHPGLDDQTMSIDLRIDVGPYVPASSGATTPVVTPAMPITNVGGGFQLLTFPFAAVADDAAQLTAILAPSTRPVDISTLGIDWSTHAAIVLTIPTNTCPPLLAGLEITDRRAAPTFVGAGYWGCNDPLLSHTVIASVERNELADVDELVLPADPTYFDAPVSAPVNITPGPAAPTAAPPATTTPFGDLLGAVALPARGEATIATLTNGTPVFVVRHHDDTISALDPRAAGAADSGNDTDAQHHLVAWTAATRNFLGRGAWDEYGRRLDGFRTSDLQGFATRVTDDLVEIGSPVPAPLGTPIALTDDPPAMANAAIPLTAPITLEQAVADPPGTTALIDATVIVDPDGARICAVESQAFPILPCPPGAPTADGITAQPDFRTAWFGPLLATRTATGFAHIAPTGGYAGGAL